MASPLTSKKTSCLHVVWVHRFWRRFLCIYIFLFFVDFLPYLLWDLGVCNREQQTWGNKVQQPKLNGFISGERFSLRIFLREIQQSNNHKPIDFGFWRLGYGISLHNLLLGISPHPKNWGNDDRPRRQRRHQSGKVVLVTGRAVENAEFDVSKCGRKLSKKGVYKKEHMMLLIVHLGIRKCELWPSLRIKWI